MADIPSILMTGTTQGEIAMSVSLRSFALACLPLLAGSTAVAAAAPSELVCRYDNGSIAFSLDTTTGKAKGDMRPHEQKLRKTDKTLEFDVVASETTLLMDLKVTIHLDNLKWTANKPGWGGQCSQP
jgi:hypothetical protein